MIWELNPHSEDMAINALKVVGVAALILLTAGANVRYGALMAVGVCIMGAVLALYFVAP
jgi:hypothetical protein